MSSKSEVLAKVINTNTYIGSAVKMLVNEVTCDASIIPTHLRKSDVIKLSSGVKIRPCVIVKVKKDYVVAIPLTSKQNIHNLCVSESRFFGNGYFCNNYITAPIELARENFIGVYDNSKVLNNAIKELRIFIGKNI